MDYKHLKPLFDWDADPSMTSCEISYEFLWCQAICLQRWSIANICNHHAVQNMSPAPLWFAQPYKDRRLKHGISTWGFPKIGVPQIHVSNTMFFSWEWKRENCKRKGSWAHQQTDKITPRTKMLENQIPSCERIGVSMSYKVALQEGWKISLEDGLIISNFGWFGVPVF